MTELVRLSGIRKNFAGVQALKGVDFDLRAGEVHALVGENGAGKSTLMRVLAGEIAPTSGTVSLNGEPVQLSGPRDATGRGAAVSGDQLTRLRSTVKLPAFAAPSRARSPVAGFVQR